MAEDIAVEQISNFNTHINQLFDIIGEEEKENV